MDQCPEYDFEVHWKPFLLRKNIPVEGYKKAPDTPSNPRVGKRLKEAGKASGVDFTGKCDVVPNTILAHALVSLSSSKLSWQAHDKLAVSLLKAYFTDGTDINNVDNLVKMGTEAGLGKEGLETVLKNREACVKSVTKELRNFRFIRGVPYFFLNGEPLFSGAQNSKAFVKAFKDEAKNPSS